MRRILLPAAAVALVLALAACGSPAKPLTAHELARKIPGCADITAYTPAVIETGDVKCTLRDGAEVEIGTFGNARDERRWISDGGYPLFPDPVFAGCCVQGGGWAATVSSPGPPMADLALIRKALGGRVVDG